jgi:hypothetical protein
MSIWTIIIPAIFGGVTLALGLDRMSYGTWI